MTNDDYLQVRTRTVDGRRWHIVVELDNGIAVTGCGERVDLSRTDVDVSPVGERPTGLSGNSICYGCCGRHNVERAVDDDSTELIA